MTCIVTEEEYAQGQVSQSLLWRQKEEKERSKEPRKLLAFEEVIKDVRLY